MEENGGGEGQRESGQRGGGGKERWRGVWGTPQDLCDKSPGVVVSRLVSPLNPNPPVPSLPLGTSTQTLPETDHALRVDPRVPHRYPSPDTPRCLGEDDPRRITGVLREDSGTRVVTVVVP